MNIPDWQLHGRNRADAILSFVPPHDPRATSRGTAPIRKVGSAQCQREEGEIVPDDAKADTKIPDSHHALPE